MKKLVFVLIITFSTSVSFSQKIRYHQKIPMRDGINLSATIVLPENTENPVPALFVLTPYIADRNISLSWFYAQNGYAVVTTDIRGRGNSEGKCQPFSTQDGKDGYDVIEWISQQKWCNGKVGMFGGSYLGMTQWQTLKEMPEALKTIVPAASVGPGVDFPKRNNIFYTYLAPYMTFISGNTSNQYSFTNIEIWKDLYKKLYTGQIAYQDMFDGLGISDESLKLWLEHPMYDEFWYNIIPTASEYKKFEIPILTITGYYDDDQIGAFNYYASHIDAKSPDNHYLVIGPWDHSGTRRPQAKIGDLEFSKNAVLDMNQLHLQWFNWTLKDGDKPDFLKNKVAFYHMGEEVWKFESSIESLAKFHMELYLNSLNASANSIFNCGSLDKEPPVESIPDQYEYNPLKSKFLEEDLKEGHLINYSLYHNSEIFKNEGLYYKSQAFNKPITIAGRISLTTFIEMDVPDADFEILLYEITEAGEIIFLTTDYLRARYRNDLSKEEFPKQNQVNKYVFETPYLFVRKIQKGSSLLLIIRNLNSPHYQKNFQSGKAIGTETKQDALSSKVKLYHDSKHKSILKLPVYIIHD
jgi:putative CocE/NonD family hydrolase